MPRSPYESLGGVVFLPRAIDKARAEVAGTLGEYHSRTGYSAELFEFLGIAVEAFHEAIRVHATDAAMLGWVESNMTERSPAEIAAWNAKMMTRVPATLEAEARYRQQLEDMGQAHRTDLSRNFDRFDLDEGRDVPLGGRRWELALASAELLIDHRSVHVQACLKVARHVGRLFARIGL